MTRRLFTFIFTLVPVYMMAQSVQPGFVKQYNEKLDKSALPGVEIIAYGAQSAQSDERGAFNLKFNTLAAGDRVFCSRIARDGYILFNQDDVEQWNISNAGKPFTIVMCREEKFMAIKNSYFKVTSNSYARQQEAEENAIKAEFKAGKMKKAEHDRKLAETRQYYADQLKNIDTYIDLFARIDLSELSAEEQSIVDLVRAGNIESAINKYENLNYIEKYEREVKEIRQLESIKSKVESIREGKLMERDSIYKLVQHQVSAYMMLGGKNNVDKAGSLLKLCADADTTNYNAVLQYSCFAGSQNIYEDADKYTMICYRMLDRMFVGKEDIYNLQAASLENNLGVLYSRTRNYEKAMLYLGKALSRYEAFCNKSLLYANLYLQTAQSISNAYYSQNKAHDAFDYLEKAYDMNKRAIEEFPEYANNFLLSRLDILTSLKTYDLNEFHNYDDIIDNSEIEVIMNLYRSNPEVYFKTPLRALVNVGCAYMYKGNCKEGEPYLLQALDIARRMEKRNPDKDIIDYLVAYQAIATLYMHEGEYAKSETMFKELYEKTKTLHDQDPAPFDDLLHSTEYDMGLLYPKMNKPVEATSMLLKAKDGLMNMAGISRYVKYDYFLQINFLLTGVYSMQSKMEEAFAYCNQNIEFYRKGMKYPVFWGNEQKLARDNDGNYIMDASGTAITTHEYYYAESLNNAAYYYAWKGDLVKALECVDEAIPIIPKNPNFYDSKGEFLFKLNRIKEAKEMYRKVLELNPRFYEQNPGSELYKMMK